MPYIGIYRCLNFVRFEQVTTSASIAQTNSGGYAYAYIVRIENYRFFDRLLVLCGCFLVVSGRLF